MENNNSDIVKNKPETSTLPELMTEDDLIQFLRIPEISISGNYHNVVEHLKKFRSLPRIHICRKALFPKKAILEWMEKETGIG